MFVKRLRQIVSGLILCAMLMGGMTMSASAAFEDVPAGHWAEKEIQRCVEKGFFKGVSAESFGLGQPMTRSAAVVVLCRFFGWETPVPTQPTYRDVPVNIWYAGAVQAAYDHGALTSQWEDFRPADPVTREELAVMLVRALGYSTLAGLAQNLEIPLEDVTTNAGYITMAYDLGLLGGTSATTFSGEKFATREQVAVILMRLYDKLQSTETTEKIGILSPGAELGDLTGYTAVAVPGVRLIGAGRAAISETLEDSAVRMMRKAVQDSGAKALMYVVGGLTSLNAKPEEIASLLKAAAEERDFDGILLDIPKLKGQKAAALTKLVQALKKELKDDLVCVMAEAPTQQGTAYEGYDYAALSRSADKVILWVASQEAISGSVVTAPLEPLENVYYALRELDDVNMSRVSLLLTSESRLWTNGKESFALSGAALNAMLAEGTMETHYSERYACAYFTGVDEKEKPVMGWYLNEKAVAERMRMLGFFGVNQVCLKDVNTASTELLSGLK